MIRTNAFVLPAVLVVALLCDDRAAAQVLFQDDFSGPAATVTATRPNQNDVAQQTGLDPARVTFGKREIGAVHDAGATMAATASLDGSPVGRLSFDVGPGGPRQPLDPNWNQVTVQWGNPILDELNYPFPQLPPGVERRLEIDFESLDIDFGPVDVRLTGATRETPNSASGRTLTEALLVDEISSPTTLVLPLSPSIETEIDSFQLRFYSSGPEAFSGVITGVRLLQIPEPAAAALLAPWVATRRRRAR